MGLPRRGGGGGARPRSASLTRAAGRSSPRRQRAANSLTSGISSVILSWPRLISALFVSENKTCVVKGGGRGSQNVH